MKKKIIIVSIVAVVIIVLVSFTSVVGYSSVRSDLKVSLLFNIRTCRALDEDIKNTLTTNYIGKENEVVIPFLIPPRATITHNVMQKIKEIDDKMFEKLLAFIIQQTHNSDKIPPEILKAIYIIKEETDKEVYQENVNLDSVLCETVYCQSVRCDTVFKGCLIFGVFTGLFQVLDGLYVFTENIPLLKGNIIYALYQLIKNFYVIVPTLTLFCFNI